MSNIIDFVKNAALQHEKETQVQMK